MVTGISLLAPASVGPGLSIGHFGESVGALVASGSELQPELGSGAGRGRRRAARPSVSGFCCPEAEVPRRGPGRDRVWYGPTPSWCVTYRPRDSGGRARSSSGSPPEPARSLTILVVTREPQMFRSAPRAGAAPARCGEPPAAAARGSRWRAAAPRSALTCSRTRAR